MSKSQAAVGFLGAEKPYNAMASALGGIDWRAGWELYKATHEDTRNPQELRESVVYQKHPEPNPLIAKFAVGFPGTKQAVPADMDIPAMCKQVAAYSLSNLKKTATNKVSRFTGKAVRKGLVESLKLGLRAASLRPLANAPGEVLTELPMGALVFDPQTPSQRFRQYGKLAANAQASRNEYVYVKVTAGGAGSTVAQYKKVRMSDTIPGTEKTYLQAFREYLQYRTTVTGPTMKLGNFAGKGGKRTRRARRTLRRKHKSRKH